MYLFSKYFSFHLTVIILLIFCYQEYVSCKSKVVKFSDVAQQFAECVAAKEGVTLKWWNIKAGSKFFNKNPQFQKYNVTVNVTGPLKYGKKQNISRILFDYVNETQIHNDSLGIIPSIGIIQKEFKLKYNYTWNVKRALKMGMPIMADIGVPPYNYVAIKNGSIDLGHKKAQSQNVTGAVFKGFPYNVPPKTKVLAKLRVIAKTAKVPWRANVVISGFIAVALSDEKASNSAASGSSSCSAATPVETFKNVRFYKIDDLASEVLPKNEAGGLKFTAKGFLNGVDGYQFKFSTEDRNTFKLRRGKGGRKPSRKNKKTKTKKQKNKNKSKTNKNKKKSKTNKTKKSSKSNKNKKTSKQKNKEKSKNSFVNSMKSILQKSVNFFKGKKNTTKS